MTRKERLDLLKQIEKDIHVCSLESTLLDDAKSCAIHSVIEELEQAPCEDAISRQYLLDNCVVDMVTFPFNRIQEAPPVNPQEPFKPMVEIDLYSVIKQKYIERDVLDKIRAEIDKQEKWLLQAGCTACNVDLAFDAIKSVVAESEVEE